MAIRAARRRVHSDSHVSIPFGLLGTVALIGGLGYGVYWVIKSADARAEREKSASAGTSTVKAPPKIAPAPKPQPMRALPGRYEPPPMKPTVEVALVDVNTAILSAEACRYAGDVEGRVKHLSTGNSARIRLSEAVRGETAVPDSLDPGDEIIALDDVDLRKLKAETASDRLWTAVRRISPGALVKAKVSRYGQEQELYLHFPKKSSGTDVAGPPAAGGRRKISNDLGMEIQKQVLSLPPNLLGNSDRREIERILGQGDASEEEYAFLMRKLVKDDLGAMEKDRDAFRKQVEKLARLLPDAPVPDAVLTKDGRRIPGQFGGETQVAITVNTLVCPVQIDKANVRQVYTSKELREEFERRVKPSDNVRESLQALLAWTREWNLPVHREYVANVLLNIDPNDRAARLAAGYYQAAGGKWILGPSVAATGSYAPKKPETRAEMQPELESYGFKFQAGKWYSRITWSAGIENLHRQPDFKVSLQGCNLFNWYEADTPQGRLFNPTGKPKDPAVLPRLRFYAPATNTGAVHVTVEAPGALEDCHVKAVGQVIEKGHGARVEVMITPDGERTYPLYTVDDVGSEIFHDVSSMMRGKKKFTVTARLTTTVDKFHTYARFLPSLPDGKEVFWVKGTLLQPSPDVDRVWLSARP
jgi:hypothetical protein